MASTFFLSSDNWFRVLGVTNSKTGALIANATVQLAALADRNGNTPAGGSFPYTLSPVAGSAGDYEVLLPRALGVSRDVVYTAKVTIDGGAGLYRYLEEPVTVEV